MGWKKTILIVGLTLGTLVSAGAGISYYAEQKKQEEKLQNFKKNYIADTKNRLKNLQKAIEMYRELIGNYPENLDEDISKCKGELHYAQRLVESLKWNIEHPENKRMIIGGHSISGRMGNFSIEKILSIDASIIDGSSDNSYFTNNVDLLHKHFNYKHITNCRIFVRWEGKTLIYDTENYELSGVGWDKIPDTSDDIQAWFIDGHEWGSTKKLEDRYREESKSGLEKVLERSEKLIRDIAK